MPSAMPESMEDLFSRMDGWQTSLGRGGVLVSGGRMHVTGKIRHSMRMLPV